MHGDRPANDTSVIFILLSDLAVLFQKHRNTLSHKLRSPHINPDHIDFAVFQRKLQIFDLPTAYDTYIGFIGTVQGTVYKMTCVSMGNPHAVVFLDNVADLKIQEIGPYFENHKCFPQRINTEFVRVLDRHTVEMRVWERGTGETLACGTGCCAAVVACVLNGLTFDTVTVKLLGGEIEITWDRENNLVYMTGPAETVFEGEC